ncbi:MAG TPA: PTS sugar transporter subunit IIA [Candidatus Binatia bacterium]|nr:PTS sugar transporter subunit IIA [Candidatus Binatia bacterium]
MVLRLTEECTLGAVVVQPTWRNLDEAVRGLVHALTEAGYLQATAEAGAVEAVREREAMASTELVEINVSIPHARIGGINRVLIALAVSPTGVYEASPQVPISIVALMLSPANVTGAHLNYLSSLSLLLQSAPTRARLENAATAEEVETIVHAQWR